MCAKWTGSESGILRKSEYKEKKEELFVFGYSCKLFRDDIRALQIDQGKHLIPWMGDETLKIDRYDGRGALHDLSVLEAPPGGFDWRVELNRNELEMEQLCDEERYRALHTDEDEEEMYKEEELKRLHAAGYGQVGFNYDAPAEPAPPTLSVEDNEPFIPTDCYKALFPPDMILPETDKQNAIIDKTAKFIASQGTQMEILIKTKQGDNPQFQFLNRDSSLHPYYTALIALVKAGKWPEKIPEVVEEKPPENEEYLHPSLASTVIELAPSIPSIPYKPSADCDYTLLISSLSGSRNEGAPGEVAPPGTELIDISHKPVLYIDTAVPPPPPPPTHYVAYYHQYMAQTAAIQAAQHKPSVGLVKPNAGPVKSTGLSLMKHYISDSNSDNDTDDDSSTGGKDKPTIIKPPEDVQIVIDKMAAYVARNGDEFAEIVRAKKDPRFTFLEPNDIYHPYYLKLMKDKRGGRVTDVKKLPVSFSIKKLKEPDPILPKPALPYESSSEDDDNKEKQEETQTNYPVYTNIPQHVPPIVVYKLEANNTNNIINKPVEIVPIVCPVQMIPKTVTVLPEKIIHSAQEEDVKETTEEVVKVVESEIKTQVRRESNPKVKKSPTPDKKVVNTILKECSKSEREKDKRVDIPKEYAKSEKVKDKKVKDKKKESQRDRRSPNRDKNRKDEKRSHKKRAKYVKDDLEDEIISLEDNVEELIDLTGDQYDSKDEGEIETDRQKQIERRRRAAEFLKKVGVDPAAAALPTNSLASAMVDTLESIQKKKAVEEERRRKREKRRHKERYGYDDDGDKSHRKSKRRKYKSSEDEESDYDESKKKKRKKDKKTSKTKKRRRQEQENEDDIYEPITLDANLTSTLKELRTSSPTKDLVLQECKNSSEDEKKKDREYSEGEWSSDSEEDSEESPVEG